MSLERESACNEGYDPLRVRWSMDVGVDDARAQDPDRRAAVHLLVVGTSGARDGRRRFETTANFERSFCIAAVGQTTGFRQGIDRCHERRL